MTNETDAQVATEPQEITASKITIVDRMGKPRIRLLVDEDGAAAAQFLDGDGHLRMALYLKERNVDDEGYLMDAASDNEAGLLITGRLSGAAIKLGISDDAFFGKRPRLEVTEGTGWSKRRHRFPSLPPNVSD